MPRSTLWRLSAAGHRTLQLTHEFMRADFHGSPSVSREEFSLCTEPILAHVPSLKVLQWARRVGDADRTAFEQLSRQEGWPNYRIVEPDPQGQLVPAQPRAEHFPIWYAATKTGFKPHLAGISPPIRCCAAAIDKCCDTGQFVVSDPIDLSKTDCIPACCKRSCPSIRTSTRCVPWPIAARNLKGLLVGLCQIDDLVNCALNYAGGPQGIDLAIVDDSADAGKRLLYFHRSRTRNAADTGASSVAELKSSDLHYTAPPLDFGGHRWSLVCTPAPYFFSARESWRSWTVLVIGLLVTGCSAGYTWSATTRTERIQRLVDQRTAELRKKSDQLRQSQKLEAVGSLAGGIAHEFNNLLQAIGGYTRYAMEGLKPEDQSHQDLQNVLQAAGPGDALTRQLLSFSRRQTVERKESSADADGGRRDEDAAPACWASRSS